MRCIVHMILVISAFFQIAVCYLQDAALVADLAKILKQADQTVPSFLQGGGTATYKGNKYGGSDIRVSFCSNSFFLSLSTTHAISENVNCPHLFKGASILNSLMTELNKRLKFQI